jgi:hypothetical protein
MKAGCMFTGRDNYDLAVFYMLGNWKPPMPQLKSYRITFTPEEIVDNWKWLLERKKIYEDALTSGVKLAPYKYNEAWECSNCRYKMICYAETAIAKMEKKENDTN